MAFVQPFTSINLAGRGASPRASSAPTSRARSTAALREVLAWENSSEEGEADERRRATTPSGSYVDAWVARGCVRRVLMLRHHQEVRGARLGWLWRTPARTMLIEVPSRL